MRRLEQKLASANGGGYLSSVAQSLQEKVVLCEKALAASSRLKWPYESLIKTYAQQGDFDRAIDWAKKMLASVPDWSSLLSLNFLCDTVRNNGGSPRLEEFIRGGLQKDGGWWIGFKQMSHLKERERNLEEALEFAKKAWEINPADRWVAQTYVKLLIRMDKMQEADKAIRGYERAGSQQPPYSYYLRASYLEKLGDKAAALPFAKKSASMSPKDKTFAALVAKLEE